jgi:glucosamine--fructose-6-phosphate aminotransferase (isomerizing)
MLLQIQLLADSISGSKYFNQLKKLPDIGESQIRNNQSFVKDMINSNNFKSFVFLGHGPLFGIASESMLKITEMSLSISNVFHSLEFRHGPMSRVDENTLITFFISKQSLDYEKSLVKEMQDLGAKTLVICDNVTSDIKNNADFIIELNSGMRQFENLILYLPIAQFIGYYQAIKKGLNPDEPQNLTQVVTL